MSVFCVPLSVYHSFYLSDPKLSHFSTLLDYTPTSNQTKNGWKIYTAQTSSWSLHIPKDRLYQHISLIGLYEITISVPWGIAFLTPWVQSGKLLWGWLVSELVS